MPVSFPHPGSSTAHGMILRWFSDTVVYDLRWCLGLELSVQWAGEQSLIRAQPGLAVVSRCWDAGLAVRWCELSLSVSAWGFLLSLCLLPLTIA